MIKSILDGSKIQTRRIIKPQPDFDSAWKNLTNIGGLVSEAFLKKKMEGRNIPQINLSGHHLGVNSNDGFGTGICTPNIRVKVHKGDIFWVRETSAELTKGYAYKADGVFLEKQKVFKWKPSIFMPKEACRIFLKVTNVRVERLKDISEEDAIAEGIQPITAHNDPNRILGWHDYMVNPKYGFNTFFDPRESFFSLWESINGKESLDANPWVWVYDFEKTDKPKNFI